MIFDESCLLNPGDHPFIRHESFVDYRFTRIESAEHIDARVADGSFDLKEPCSPELIKRIIDGAIKSKRISREYKLLLQQTVFGVDF